MTKEETLNQIRLLNNVIKEIEMNKCRLRDTFVKSNTMFKKGDKFMFNGEICYVDRFRFNLVTDTIDYFLYFDNCDDSFSKFYSIEQINLMTKL